MTRARTTLRTVGVLGAAALLAAGCGGDAATTDPGTANPGTTTPGQAVGDPGTGDGTTPAPTTDTNGDGVIDANDAPPADGTGGPGEGLGATASIPTLDGESVRDGLSSGFGTSGGTSSFLAQAVSAEDAENGEVDPTKVLPSLDPSTKPDSSKPVARFTGAKISIDGVVFDVNRNGVFPKGSPVFRLLSVRANSVEIELVAGEFTAGGGSGILLNRGEEVSLVNASEQLSYRVTFLRPVQSDSSILG